MHFRRNQGQFGFHLGRKGKVFDLFAGLRGIGPESTVDYYKLIIGLFVKSRLFQGALKSLFTAPI
jgi:hypothetical protein